MLAQKFGKSCIITHCNNSHKAVLANCGTPGIWACFTECHPVRTYNVFTTKTRLISLTKDVTLLSESFGEWNKIKKPTVIPMVYERLYNKEIKVSANNGNNNKHNVVSNFKCKVEVTPKTTL